MKTQTSKKQNIILAAIISSVVTGSLFMFVFYPVFAANVHERFPDVDAELFYAPSINKMNDLQVMMGYESGYFGPDDYVTRGQLAVAFDRYDQKLLNPEWLSVSGIYKLHLLFCRGGLDFKFEKEGVEDVYKSLCDQEILDVH